MRVLDFLQGIKSPKLRLAWLVAIAADAIQIVALPLFVSGGLSPVDVVLDVLSRERRGSEEFGFVALLQPTSPLREPARWHDAFAHMSRGDCDAVILSATEPEVALRALLNEFPAARDVEVRGAQLEEAFLALTADETDQDAVTSEGHSR